jgi:methyl-accepting chemotaxis protein
LDQATAELKDMVRRVNKEFHSVTTDILSCAEGTEQMRGNFESATGATTQVLEIFDGLAHSVEGMVTTVDEIAHSTEEANVRTQRAVDHARGMEGRVSALTQASGEIGSIVNTISVISDQTKLLALNATIEAARAGEAGKGFAVVADEVKALATQTGQAIQDIQLKVSGILETSRGTAQDIATVAHLISEVGDSIHRVTASMEAQNHATRDISAHIGSAVNRLKAASGSVDGAAGAAMEISCHVQDVRSSIKAVEARIRGAGVQTVHLRELSERLQAASRQLDN